MPVVIACPACDLQMMVPSTTPMGSELACLNCTAVFPFANSTPPVVNKASLLTIPVTSGASPALPAAAVAMEVDGLVSHPGFHCVNQEPSCHCMLDGSLEPRPLSGVEGMASAPNSAPGTPTRRSSSSVASRAITPPPPLQLPPPALGESSVPLDTGAAQTNLRLVSPKVTEVAVEVPDVVSRSARSSSGSASSSGQSMSDLMEIQELLDYKQNEFSVATFKSQTERRRAMFGSMRGVVQHVQECVGVPGVYLAIQTPDMPYAMVIDWRGFVEPRLLLNTRDFREGELDLRVEQCRHPAAGDSQPTDSGDGAGPGAGSTAVGVEDSVVVWEPRKGSRGWRELVFILKQGVNPCYGFEARVGLECTELKALIDEIRQDLNQLFPPSTPPRAGLPGEVTPPRQGSDAPFPTNCDPVPIAGKTTVNHGTSRFMLQSAVADGQSIEGARTNSCYHQVSMFYEWCQSHWLMCFPFFLVFGVVAYAIGLVVMGLYATILCRGFCCHTLCGCEDPDKDPVYHLPVHFRLRPGTVQHLIHIYRIHGGGLDGLHALDLAANSAKRTLQLPDYRVPDVPV